MFSETLSENPSVIKSFRGDWDNLSYMCINFGRKLLFYENCSLLPSLSQDFFLISEIYHKNNSLLLTHFVSKLLKYSAANWGYFEMDI